MISAPETGLYIARYDGLSVQSVAESTMLYLSFTSGECLPLW